MPDPVLRAERVCKRFGGLVAVNEVSLALAPASLHAVIGPNGAGKSTLINLLSGELPVTSGEICLGRETVTRWPVDRIARAGLARSFQRTNVFPRFTVLENCRLAAQSRKPRFGRWLRRADAYPELLDAAHRALDTTGLSARRDTEAASLSHGEQRQLEIAMALATDPRVLLLDEPLAGMGQDESARMVELLARLSTQHAILLVEHDMDAVFSLARELTVMVDGSILASGAPATIRGNAAVQRAYLGLDPDAISA